MNWPIYRAQEELKPKGNMLKASRIRTVVWHVMPTFSQPEQLSDSLTRRKQQLASRQLEQATEHRLLWCSYVHLNIASSDSLVNMLRGNKILVFAAATIVLITSMANVSAINQAEYELQIFDSGSAYWMIRQTLTVNDTYDDLSQFQDKIQLLVEATGVVTGRNMSAEAVSLSSFISGSYISVEYVFRWYNFSEIGNGSILIGDVFQGRDLFPSLYGDGTVKMSYPSDYEINHILPSPSLRDDSLRLLEWLGTAEFDSGNVNIEFKAAVASDPGFLGLLESNIIAVAAVAAIAVVSVVGILVLRQRRTRKAALAGTPKPPILAGLESDEEKIVRMLKSAGGSAYQSALTDHFGFSRSKTSQLLSAMERKGIIKRQKSGRDKIVTLVEKDEGKKP